MAQTDELLSMAGVAQWKMRRDFELSTTSADTSWTQEWVTRLQNVVGAVGRDPNEVSIARTTVRDPVDTSKRTKGAAAGSLINLLAVKSVTKKIRISCEAAQLGTIATLRSMAAEHALNIEIITDHPTGKALTRSLLPEGSARFDFIVATIAPTVLEASSDFAKYYQVLRIPHKEELRFLRKRKNNSAQHQRVVTEGDPHNIMPPIYVVRNTSGHASLLGGNHRLRWLDHGHQLINCAITLPAQAWVAVWEPLASWLLSKEIYGLEPIGKTDLHPIALFSSRQFKEDKTTEELCKQFDQLFWLQWCKLARDPNLAWQYVSHDIPYGFCSQFGEHFNNTEFIDYDQWGTAVSRKWDKTERPKAIHNADYTMVNWFGQQYTFALGVQSQVVEILWKEWEATGMGLHQQTIRDHVDDQKDNFRMTTAFRNHPAMGTMIHMRGDGRYQLCPPDIGDENSKSSPKKA
jgi:hypothetical protein